MAVALAVEGDGVGFATESYAASALYTTLVLVLARFTLRQLPLELTPGSALTWPDVFGISSDGFPEWTGNGSRSAEKAIRFGHHLPLGSIVSKREAI